MSEPPETAPEAPHHVAELESPDISRVIRDAVNVFTAVGSSVIGAMGVVGTYGGENFGTACGLLVLTAVASSVIGARWRRAVGTPTSLVIVSAIVFLPLAAAFVVITGGVDSAMWLLFLVGALSTAAIETTTARANLIATCTVMVASMWGTSIVERGVLLDDALTVAIRLSAIISTWCVAAATIGAMRRALEERARTELLRHEVEAAAQLALTSSLREKETLLNEVHHRVKNNLQIVSSLLTMQMDHSTDPAVRGPLLESTSRVRSMALIHEQLYSSLSKARVDLVEYTKRLTRSLASSLGRNAHIDVSGDAVELPVDVAVPCGLILNELVTNALKYGIAPDGTCHVRVHIASRDEGFSLTVGDRGPGLPSGTDITKTDTLGMQLVHALARQIRATLEVDDSEGTEFRLYRDDSMTSNVFRRSDYQV